MAFYWSSLIVFLGLYMNVYSCTYGNVPPCVFPCNCENSTEQCYPVSGACPTSGCKDGPPAGYPWSGAGCRIGNVAYGKPATQTDTIGSYKADQAVDGNTRTTAYSSTSESVFARWMVDLQGPHVIDHITVIAPNSELRPYALSMYVSNNSHYMQHDENELCATYPGEYLPIQTPVTFQCNTSNLARYVSLKNGEAFQKMHISEVIVMGYRVVSDCTACAGSKCDDISGCDSCVVGKRRPDCKQDCNENFFGAGCSQECHCRQGVCDSVSGVCDASCEDWWILSTCSVYIPAPNMSHVTPRVSILSSTSLSLHFQQLQVDDDITEYYEYVAEYKTNDSDFARSGDVYQLHDKTSQENSLIIDQLQPGVQYSFRVRAFRNIRTFKWNNEQRSSGAPSQEARVQWNNTEASSHIALIAGVGVVAAVLLVVISALAGFFCARNKYRLQAPPPQSPPPSNPAFVNDQANYERIQRGNMDTPIEQNYAQLQ